MRMSWDTLHRSKTNHTGVSRRQKGEESVELTCPKNGEMLLRKLLASSRAGGAIKKLANLRAILAAADAGIVMQIDLANA